MKIPVEWYDWEEYSKKVVPIKRKLGYSPKYTPEESMERAVS